MRTQKRFSAWGMRVATSPEAKTRGHTKAAPSVGTAELGPATPPRGSSKSSLAAVNEDEAPAVANGRLFAGNPSLRARHASTAVEKDKGFSFATSLARPRENQKRGNRAGAGHLRKPSIAPLGLLTQKRGSVWLLLLTLVLCMIGLWRYAWPWLMGRSYGDNDIVIQRATYVPVEYHHIDTNVHLALPDETRVFHVTKEFGPASMGGMGTALTALAIAEQNSPRLNVSIIMPYYSYLRESLEPRPRTFAELAVKTKLSGTEQTVNCHIYKYEWGYQVDDFLNPDEIERAERLERMHIDVYLVGPGDKKPFKNAFKASSAQDVYSSYAPLPQEWKELWFAKAAAEFLSFLATDTGASVFEADEQDSNSDEDVRTGVDIVHLHGATNAFVMSYLDEYQGRKFPGHKAPAVVYTLHDYTDELEYSNWLANMRPFFDSLDTHHFDEFVHGQRVFPSAMAIERADVVTLVSEPTAEAMVEARFDFYLKEWVMPAIQAKATQGDFVGITNGLDFTDHEKNPFSSALLQKHGVSFPRVGGDALVDTHTFERRDAVTSILPASSFIEAKERALRILIEHLPQHFSQADLVRPVLLFIGRFQYNKGCEFFAPLLQLLDQKRGSHLNDARLVVMGAPNNFPRKKLLALQKQHPTHFTLIEDEATQRAWGSLIRMASDFALVPSFAESFGLIAAEGLLYGMPVISSGVGGLAEFLTEYEASELEIEGNAFLFDALADLSPDVSASQPTYKFGDVPSRSPTAKLHLATAHLLIAVRRAIAAWRAMQGDSEHSWEMRELQARHMVASALSLAWDREGGPLDHYLHVYDMALQRRKEAEPHIVDLKGSVKGEDDEYAEYGHPSEPEPAIPHSKLGLVEVQGRTHPIKAEFEREKFDVIAERQAKEAARKRKQKKRSSKNKKTSHTSWLPRLW
ncbi:glycosyltransferase family 5 protein [Mixia osmundae IAM 14324]|uniref:Uncharacterized protein n=1 Tax=Mixia osmundae (strain CBS 9802 / IAM 14324 / JCM 22182 / KY 12970) TaxID=764103 RepID=G7E101_MIXOS|nr:glycosyltransferase family 5 protein [Mixia osmundae IAM 14324]KEI38854.1 glycosyltransferase family 5 protein [Mixia osmundae IAM 14324]GAA96511.1 hypothetical protein E5Q_03179 [Mixia osmundae IAM 14324]